MFASWEVCKQRQRQTKNICHIDHFCVWIFTIWETRNCSIWFGVWLYCSSNWSVCGNGLGELPGCQSYHLFRIEWDEGTHGKRTSGSSLHLDGWVFLSYKEAFTASETAPGEEQGQPSPHCQCQCVAYSGTASILDPGFFLHPVSKHIWKNWAGAGRDLLHDMAIWGEREREKERGCKHVKLEIMKDSSNSWRQQKKSKVNICSSKVPCRKEGIPVRNDVSEIDPCHLPKTV